jgi:uncharacterized membrane protein
MAAPERPNPPIDLDTTRLEAFSDAVMAVIITILALELRPPDGTSYATIRSVAPSFGIYVLSFVMIAIYWNNHHHLLRATTRISGGVMWANMALLFCLSLIPVATEWIRDTYGHVEHDPTMPAMFLGAVLFAAATAYYILVRAIIRANGSGSLVGTAVHADVKGTISLVIYAAGIALAPLTVWLSYALYIAVAVMWLIPDRRFTHVHLDDGTHPS